MKYADMQLAKQADLPTTNGVHAEPNSKPLITPAVAKEQVSRPVKSISLTPVPFRLFKSHARAEHAYTGQVTLPDGRSWLINADVVQDAQGNRSFEGTVYPCNAPSLLRGAKVTGKPTPQILDLVGQCDPLPFNDELPSLVPRGTNTDEADS